MVQRQRTDIGRLHARRHSPHGRAVPGFGLQHVGNHIAVQQHGALGNTGGAAGVLQHGHVVRLDVGPLEAAARPLGHRVIETHGARQIEGRHHFLDVANHVIDQRALEHAELVTHGREHHMFDGRIRNALFQRVGEVFDDDNCLGAGILELVLEFARGVQRIDVDHHKTGTQDGGHRHRVLRNIGHHDGHTVALDQPQPLQVSRERLRQAVGLAEGDLLAHEAVGDGAGVFRKALFHQGHQRGVLGRIDVSRNARGVGAQPGSVYGGCIHACLLRMTIEQLPRIVVARPSAGLLRFP